MSIVDQLCAEYGFAWKLNPYRIEDVKTGKVVQAGPSFDVTPKCLKQLRQNLDKQLITRFQTPKDQG